MERKCVLFRQGNGKLGANRSKKSGYVVKILRTLTLICALMWVHIPIATAQVDTTDTPIEVTGARLAHPNTSDTQTTVLDPVTPEAPFDGIVFTWHVDGNPNHVRLAFRVQIDDVWQNWQSMGASDEFRHEDATANEYTSTMYSFAQSARAWQVSVLYAQNTSARLLEVHATTMSSLQVAPRIDPSSMAAPEANGAKPSIVPRATWGGSTVQAWDARGNACAGNPSSCPADATWMPEGSEIGAPTHIVIHHTATPNYDAATTNWASIVRNIWQYHASSNNWGDIGYHLLIDPNGVIYEGRYTGIRDNGTTINGAHAYAFNYGSIGVSMIGTYSSAQPTPAAQASLRNVLSWLVTKYNITPGVERPYRPHPSNSNYAKYVNYNGGAGVNLNTIEGHRVTGALASQIIAPGWGTSCPGDALYAMLPDIRRSVTPTDWIPNVTVSKSTVYTDEPVTFNVTIRNAYLSSSISGAAFTFEDAGFVYNQDQCWAWKDGGGNLVFNRPPSNTNPNQRFRMIAGYSNWDGAYANTPDQCATASTANHPWRWSIGDANLAPGGTRVVTGKVSFQQIGTYKVFFGLVKDWVGYPDGGCVFGNPYGACGLRSRTIRVIERPTATPTYQPISETILAAATGTAQIEQTTQAASLLDNTATAITDRAAATQESLDGSPTRTKTPTRTRTGTATAVALMQTANTLRTATRDAILSQAATAQANRAATALAVQQIRLQKQLDTAATRTAQADALIAVRSTRTAIAFDRQTATAEVALLTPSRTPSPVPSATNTPTITPTRTKVPSRTATATQTATATITPTPTLTDAFDEAQRTSLAIANDPKAVLALDTNIVVLESNQQNTTDVAVLNLIDPTSMTSLNRIPVSATQAFVMTSTPDNSQLFVAGRIDWNMVVVQRFTVAAGALTPSGLWITQSTGVPTAIAANNRYVYLAVRAADGTTNQLFVVHNSQNGLFGVVPPISAPGQINALTFVDQNDTHLLAGGSYSDGRGFISPVYFNGRFQARGVFRLSQGVQSLSGTGAITKLRPELTVHAGSATMLTQLGYDILSNRLRIIVQAPNIGANVQATKDTQLILLATAPTPVLTFVQPVSKNYQVLATANPADWGITPLSSMAYLADAVYILENANVQRVPLIP